MWQASAQRAAGLWLTRVTLAGSSLASGVGVSRATLFASGVRAAERHALLCILSVILRFETTAKVCIATICIMLLSVVAWREVHANMSSSKLSAQEPKWWSHLRFLVNVVAPSTLQHNPSGMGSRLICQCLSTCRLPFRRLFQRRLSLQQRRGLRARGVLALRLDHGRFRRCRREAVDRGHSSRRGVHLRWQRRRRVCAVRCNGALHGHAGRGARAGAGVSGACATTGRRSWQRDGDQPGQPGLCGPPRGAFCP